MVTCVTIFAAMLNNTPMGCTDYVLPELLPKNVSVNCLISNKDNEPFKHNLCLFRALLMYMNGHNDLDSQTTNFFTEFISKSGYGPKNFRGLSVEDTTVVENFLQGNIFIYNFDIQEGENVEELARRFIKNSEKQSNY